MERADVWTRLGAALVDLPIWWVMNIAMNLTEAKLGVAPPVIMATVIALMVTYSLADIAWAGTPGKRLRKLRIRSEDGTPAPRSRLAIRWALKHALPLTGLVAVLLVTTTRLRDDPEMLMTTMPLAGIAMLAFAVCFFVALGQEKQTLYDVLSRTAVYRVTPGASAQGGAPL